MTGERACGVRCQHQNVGKTARVHDWSWVSARIGLTAAVHSTRTRKPRRCCGVGRVCRMVVPDGYGRGCAGLARQLAAVDGRGGRQHAPSDGEIVLEVDAVQRWWGWQPTLAVRPLQPVVAVNAAALEVGTVFVVSERELHLSTGAFKKSELAICVLARAGYAIRACEVRW